MSPETIAVGVFSIGGTLLGVAAGLFGAELGRGAVRDNRLEDHHRHLRRPEESHLDVRFLNEKELPVVVWDMRVEFYKGDELFEKRVHSTAMFADEATGRRSSSGPANLPPRVAFTRTIVLIASREDKRWRTGRCSWRTSAAPGTR